MDDTSLTRGQIAELREHGVLRLPPRQIDEDLMYGSLRKAAQDWLQLTSVPAHAFRLADYSTCGNEFLWLAESAYCDALKAAATWVAENPPAAVPAVEAVPNRGCYLYRLWGDDDRLLYVGVSTKLRARLRTHKRRWGDLIRSVTWEPHEDERSMLEAERIAIRDEDPALNRAGAG